MKEILSDLHKPEPSSFRSSPSEKAWVKSINHRSWNLTNSAPGKLDSVGGCAKVKSIY